MRSLKWGERERGGENEMNAPDIRDVIGILWARCSVCVWCQPRRLTLFG